jgi:hypothetical protein
MINKNQLRIGNWVKSKVYGNYRIIGISVFSESNNFYKSFKYYPQSCDSKNLLPIKITNDWLLRFGFKDKGLFFKHKSNHVIEYDSINKVYLFYLGNYGDWYKKIKYVHELQNLFFALTSKEIS